MCNDCAICIEPLFPENTSILRLKNKVLVKRGERLPITKLKCGHVFHNKCIKKWFKNIEIESSTKCPMCRDNIRFKPDSKDLMMNKIRHNNRHYKYSDKSGYRIPRYVFRFPVREEERYVFRFPGFDDDAVIPRELDEDEIDTTYEQIMIGVDWSIFSFDDEGNVDWEIEPENPDRELVYYDYIL